MSETFVKVEGVKALAGSLDRLAKRQLPFAIAKSLTDTAKDAQSATQRQTRKEFNLHGPFIPNGIRITAARKHDLVRYGFCQATVYTAPKISGFMPDHETGESRSPRRVTIATPAKDLKRKAYRTKTGKVKKTYKPESLLRDYKPYRGGRKAITGRPGRGKGKAFITRTKRGSLIIAQRTGRKRYPLATLYNLIDKAKIKPRWRFKETAMNDINLHYEWNFRKNIELAIRTAT